MAEQLPLDFSASTAVRQRRAMAALPDEGQSTLFEHVPNIDVHLHSPAEAVASVQGPEPERTFVWLTSVVGGMRQLKSRRFAFSTAALDRLLHVRPPAQVTLDASAQAVARAIWANKAGLRPLRVRRERQRLLASSVRWPSGFRVQDAPWPAIAAITHLGLPLDVEDRAKNLMHTKLANAGEHVAVAGLAGSAVLIETNRPELVEALGLPALAYAGEPSAGRYKMPLGAAECLLAEPTIKVSADLASAIRKATKKPRPLQTAESFPWTLYGFQARDAAQALRILETTGGVLLAGSMGSGKSVSCYTPVASPGGPVPIGQLSVGDRVMGTDGEAHLITGVYPQGERDLFRVTFSDGSTVDCDDEHLWAVNTPSRRYNGSPYQVKTLAEIRTKLHDKHGNRQHFVPTPEPLHLEHPGPRPLDPYVLGALIGDGSFVSGSPTFASIDGFVIDELRRHLPSEVEVRVRPGSDKDWRITTGVANGAGRHNPVISALRELGLWGKRAWEKTIPDAYLYAPLPDRIALLQGLMDTDGTVGKTNETTYVSTSFELVTQIQQLVGSLGGTARVNGPFNKTYTHKGEKRHGRDSWRICLQLPASVCPFRLPRKADRYQPRTKYLPARSIESVEPIGRGEAVCISVDSPDHLFVLANSVTTHNTTVALAVSEDLDCWPLLVVAPLAAFSTWARQLGEMGRSYYIANEIPAKSWKTIEDGHYDAIVISYDRLHAFSELIERYGFQAIVADELQRIRTPTSRRSRALRQLAGAVPIRIGLSGTPLQNRLDDLLPLGAFLAPGEWKPKASNRDLDDLYPGDPIQAVTEHLATLMVRRRMEDTGVKLPGKTVRRVYVDLTPEQRRALEDLEAEAEAAKEEGELGTRMHVFARLQKMRQIVANPTMAGVAGPNPKLAAAIDLAEEYIDMGRKGIIFCANRQTWLDLHKALKTAGIKSTGIWGSSSVADRLAAERQFHDDPDMKVFVGTLASCAESLTLSPTATFCVFCDLSYSPSDLSQAEARAYRMNTTEPVDITYLHARGPAGTIDDRMTELLNIKRALFAKVIDGDHSWADDTQVQYSMGDLVYLLTGKRDEALDARGADNAAAVKREQDRKAHARATAHRHKRSNAEFVWDDGSIATILDDSTDPDDLDDDLVLVEADDDGFDVEADDDETAEIVGDDS